MTPLDDGGYTSPFEDDEHLDGDVGIYRAVHPLYFDWDAYEEGGERVVSKQAFTAMREDEALQRGYPGRAMSVGLVDILNEQFAGPDAAVGEFLMRAQKVGWGVAVLRASDIRLVDPPLGLCEDAVADQPWHALVFPLDRGNINTKAQKQLADFCELVRPPER